MTRGQFRTVHGLRGQLERQSKPRIGCRSIAFGGLRLAADPVVVAVEVMWVGVGDVPEDSEVAPRDVGAVEVREAAAECSGRGTTRHTFHPAAVAVGAAVAGHRAGTRSRGSGGAQSRSGRHRFVRGSSPKSRRRRRGLWRRAAPDSAPPAFASFERPSPLAVHNGALGANVDPRDWPDPPPKAGRER
jgi:hypothetical protein